MKHLVFLAAAYILLLNNSYLLAQESAKKTKKDRAYEFSIWEDNYIYKGKPSIELLYGQSDISLKNSGLKFKENGAINLKLGWHKERETSVKNIAVYRSNFITGTYSSNSINIRNPVSGSPVTLNFGIGSSDGYGYKLGKNSSLVLYNSSSITWTRYDKGAPTEPVQTSYDKRDDFNRTLRFGSTAEGGIIIPLGSLLNLQVSYDRSIVFPRHMVWKHMGSAIIEAAGQSLIDGFVHAIFRSSPFAAPIVSFILKNSLSYGLYELRREKMNWPFESAEPLLFDTFKAGIKFKF